MTITLNSLISDKTVKRGDLLKVRIADLVIVEGFNESRKFNDPQALRDHIDGMKAFVRSGGTLPPIEVWVNPETGATEVVEGHCRTINFRELELEGFELKPGVPLEWVSALPFTGSTKERKARVATSNSQLPLAPLGYASIYKDLRDNEGMVAAEIATLVGKSRGHVDQMLLLADAGEKVHEAVTAGVVSPTEAVKIAREFKQEAGAEIERRQEAAAEAGKGRVTASVAKPAKPKKKAGEYPHNLVAAARAIKNSLGDDFEKIVLGECASAEEVRSDLLAELLMAIADIPEQEAPVKVDDSQLDMHSED